MDSENVNGEHVEELADFEPGYLYKIAGGEGRKYYFKLRYGKDEQTNVYWKDEEGNILDTTLSGEPSLDGYSEEDICYQNSSIGFNYFDGYCGDPTLEVVKRRINEGTYLKLGKILKKRHLIPDQKMRD